jgi:hypothetical protein
MAPMQSSRALTWHSRRRSERPLEVAEMHDHDTASTTGDISPTRPTQDMTRPSERTIGDSLRSDGPNGQSSTSNNANDSIVERLDAGEPIDSGRRDERGAPR